MAEEVVFRDVMKAVYDYAATADDELTMKEGQLLYLLGNLDDDWAKVQVHVPLGAFSEAEPPAGLVPSAYIRLVPPLYRAVALYDYDPDGEGEILMKEDEKLSVYLKEDEWILVKIDRKGTVSQPAIGYVPANYIEESEGDGEASAQTMPVPQAVVSIPPTLGTPTAQADNAERAAAAAAKLKGDPVDIWKVSKIDTKGRKKKGTLCVGIGWIFFTSDADQAPVQKWQEWEVSMVTSVYINEDKHKHVNVEIKTANGEIPLEFGASSRDEANAIVDKVDRSKRLAVGESSPPPKSPEPAVNTSAVAIKSPTPSAANGGLSIPPPAHPGLSPSPSGRSKGVHWDTAPPAEIPQAVQSDEESEDHTAAAAAAPKPNAGGIVAIAVYDFEADGDDELTVKEGEKLTVLDKEESEEWWKCRNSRRKQGFVPASYLEARRQVGALTSFRLTQSIPHLQIESAEEVEDSTAAEAAAAAARAEADRKEQERAAAAAAKAKRLADESRRKREQEAREAQDRLEQEEAEAREAEAQRLRDRAKEARRREVEAQAQISRKSSTNGTRKKSMLFNSFFKYVRGAQDRQEQEEAEAREAEAQRLRDRREAEAQAQTSRKSSNGTHKSSYNRGQSKDLPGRPNVERPKPTKTRIWHDRSGGFKVEAQFVGIHNNQIRLHKTNGVIIGVPEEKMSAKDMEFIRKLKTNPTSLTSSLGSDDVPLDTLTNRGSPQGPPWSSRPPAPLQRQSHFDWFEFFLNSGCDLDDCTRYELSFEQEKLDEAILPDLKPDTLRGLGLREGDIIRVMKHIEQRGWKVAGPRAPFAPVPQNEGLIPTHTGINPFFPTRPGTVPATSLATAGATPSFLTSQPTGFANVGGGSGSGTQFGAPNPGSNFINAVSWQPTWMYAGPPNVNPPPDNNSPANIFAAMKAGSFANSAASQSSDKYDALRPQPAGWNALRAGVQPQATGFNPGFTAGLQPGATFGQQPGFQQPMQAGFGQPGFGAGFLPLHRANNISTAAGPSGSKPATSPPPFDGFGDIFADPWLPHPTSEANKPAPTPTIATPTAATLTPAPAPPPVATPTSPPPPPAPPVQPAAAPQPVATPEAQPTAARYLGLSRSGSNRSRSSAPSETSSAADSASSERGWKAKNPSFATLAFGTQAQERQEREEAEAREAEAQRHPANYIEEGEGDGEAPAQGMPTQHNASFFTVPDTTPNSPATKLAPRLTTGSGKWVKFVTVVPGQHARFRIQDDTPPIYGGFSDVWRCDARFSDGRVIAAAMKKFRAVRIASDADACTVTNKLLKRLTKELGIWMALQHPRISPLLGFALEDDLCTISPWYTNGSVTEYIDRHPEVDRIKLVSDVASGLAYLHTRVPLVVHGDMKADNVLIDDAGNAVIIDFGLSAIVEDDPTWATSLVTTSSLQGAGNARWMAPELMMEEGCTRSPSTDVYSFGCVALQIYTGEIPFKDVPTFRIVHVLIEGQMPLAKREDTQLSSPSLDWFYDLLVSCWDENPAARPSMVEVESKMRMGVRSGGVCSA